ncbi:MAG: TetR/AcrR family transcriptional regulator [Actinobacteria bacterium]|nr:MAG: TetR/AcrR family transcriptional regulator [Actinomycetota bacterium]
MPKLWDETIEAHRREVRGAILDAAAALVAKHGLLSVTMSKIAEETGIGRATLYKYFPDVESILLAWHERHVTSHLGQLTALAEGTGDVLERLARVLEAYALILYGVAKAHGIDLSVFLHRGEHVGRAQERLKEVVATLLTEAAEIGRVRDDVEPEELSAYCLHALSAADSLPSKAAVHRLVQVTLTGLRPDNGR